jgi:predicted nucleotidyltransferase
MQDGQDSEQLDFTSLALQQQYNTDMSNQAQSGRKVASERCYRGANIPMAVIRRFARQVARRFQPEKIILFGSHAYGKPHADSDVDILVVMPARNQLDQSFKIRLTIPAPFPMDLIVRTPKNMKWRLAEGESFLTEILAKGKVLYEKDHSGVGTEGRRGPRSRRPRQSKPDSRL